MALPKLQQVIVNPRVVKPRDYTLAGNTINALNERHDAALAQRSAIANDLAKNYVLHESEDEFKTNFTNEMLGRIDEKIDANSGYAGNALSETIKVAGEYAIDPRLIGRVRANNEYQSFVNRILNSDISDRQKQYLLDKNPYFYADKYEGETDKDALKNRADEKLANIQRTDKIVGGTNWSSNIDAVKEQDINGFMAKVLSQVAKDYGGVSDTIYYKTGVNSDGSPIYSTDASKSIDGMWYYTNRNLGYEALRKDKIADAISNAFDSNPEYEEWLRRSWEIGIWENSRGKEEDNPVLDSHKLSMGYDEYKRNVINRFAKDASYYQPKGSTMEAGIGMQALATAAKTAAKSTGKSGKEINPKSFLWNHNNPSGMIEIDVETSVGKYARSAQLKGNINSYAKQLNLEIGKNDSIDDTYNNIKDYYNRNNEQLPAELINAYKESKKLDEQVKADFGDDKRLSDAFYFKAALDNGVDLATLNDNEYVKDYLNKVKEVFTHPDGQTLPYIYFPVRNAKAILNAIPNYGALGLSEYTDKNGQIFIRLDKDHSQYLYQVNKTIGESGLKTRGVETLSRRPKDEYADLYEPNSIHSSVHSFRGNWTPTYSGTFWRDIYGDMHASDNENWTNTFVNDIEDPYVNATNLLVNKKVDMENNRKAMVNLYTNTYNNTMEEYARAMGLEMTSVKDARDITPESLTSLTGAQTELQIGTNLSNARFTVDDNKTKSDIITIVQGIMKMDPDRIQFHSDILGTGTLITVAADLDPKSKVKAINLGSVGNETVGKQYISANDQFSIYIPNWLNQEVEELVQNTPGYKEKIELVKNHAAGYDTSIMNGTYKLDSENGKDFYLFDDNGSYMPLKAEEAASWLKFDRLADNYNSIIISNKINREACKEFLNGTLQMDDNTPDIYPTIVANVVKEFAKVVGEVPFTNEGELNVSNWNASNQAMFKEYVDYITRDI